MVELKKYWVYFLALVAALPGLALILRGGVWGSDSFAYWSVSCGNNFGVSGIHSPQIFIWFIQHVISCNIATLAAVMFIFYFLALVSSYLYAKHFINGSAWRAPFYLATLTPLFFIEALRFEQEFFGWTLALIVLGLISILMGGKNGNI